MRSNLRHIWALLLGLTIFLSAPPVALSQPDPDPNDQAALTVGSGPVVSFIIKMGASLAPDDAWKSGKPCIFSCSAGADRGPFVFARDWLRGLAFIMILPFALVTILHSMLTKSGGLEDDLSKMGIQLFVVVIALKNYHLYDQAIWYGLVEPFSAMLQSKDMLDEAVASAFPGAPPSHTGGSGPTQDTNARLFSMISAPGVCGIGAQNGFQDESIRKTCQNLPPEVRDAVGKQLAIWENDGERPDLNNPELPDDDRSFWQKTGDKLVNAASATAWVITNPGEAIVNSVGEYLKEKYANFAATMMRSWTGIMMNALRLLVLAFMWVVWLGVIFARAISLTLAPVPFALSLLPGGDKRLYTWFESHTKLLFKPLAFSFGFYLYYIFAISLFAAVGPASIIPTVGNAMMVSLIVIFMILCWKMNTILDAVAGDTTKVAAAFGSAAKDATFKAVSIGAAAVTGGMAGAASVAASAASSSSGSGSAHAPSSSPSGVSKGAQQTHNAMNQVSGLADPDRLPTTGGMASLPSSRVSRTTKAKAFTKGFLKEGTKAVMQETDIGRKVLGLRDKSKESKRKLDEIRKSEGDKMIAAVDDTTLADANAHTLRIEREREQARKEGRSYTPPALRAKEKLPPLKNDPRLVIRADSQEEFDDINSTMTALSSTPVYVREGQGKAGHKTVELSGDTLSRLADTYFDTPAFRQLVDAEAARCGVGNMQHARGEVVDLAVLLQRSPVFAKAIALKGKETALQEQELLRREKVGKLSLELTGSVGEIMVREMSPQDFDPIAGGGTQADQSDYTQRHAKAATRVAWAELNGIGDDPVALRFDTSLDAAISAAGWNDANALAALPNADQVRAAMDRAHARLKASFGAGSVPSNGPIVRANRGEMYGIDPAEYRRTLGASVKYAGAPGSLFEQELSEWSKGQSREKLTPETHQMAYNFAKATATKDLTDKLAQSGVQIPNVPADSPEWNAFIAPYENDIHLIMFGPPSTH